MRSILVGMILGGALSLCNVYMGLKIGWSFNMSITAALLSYGMFHILNHFTTCRPWTMVDNNLNQTAASAAASISSAGLVAPIPAWTLITGQEMSFWQLSIWTASVALVGVVVAIGLRRQMLIQDPLPFPNGVATGETLLKMYGQGSEALVRVKMLILGMIAGILTKLSLKWFHIKYVVIPAKVGVLSFKNLTFVLSPSPLFVAVGAIIGTRASISMIIGAMLAWGILGPIAIHHGWVFGDVIQQDGTTITTALNHALWMQHASEGMWFKEMVTWLLWPGVAMMVTASLTSFSFSWPAIWQSIKGKSPSVPSNQSSIDSYSVREDTSLHTTQCMSEDELPRTHYMYLILFVSTFSILLQVSFFGIGWGVATLGIVLTFILAIVAARVSGETGLTPIGAMGKITQLTFGVIASGQVSTNLMAANVTGGAASQCGDLLHDLKTGLMIGASPRQQIYAQLAGVIAGALCGSYAYLLLVGDFNQLQHMWHDPEWAMPAVVQWKAVAELFQQGVKSLPNGAGAAMIWGGTAGMLLAGLEKILPAKWSMWIPSPTAVGLAFVIPAYYSVSMALGGIIAWVSSRLIPQWSNKFLTILAAGLIAGDSLSGVGIAIWNMLNN